MRCKLLHPVPRLLSACIALACSGLALAAEPSPAGDSRHDTPAELDTVVVNASPLRQAAEALAQPVEILAGEKLDEARSATLGETVGRLPGVQSSNFGAGVGRPIIRGLDGARVSTLAGGLATQDVSTISQDHNVTLEPFLADQIEVLKGPATLLYGSGAIGGVVNVVDGRIAERPLDSALQGRAEWRSHSVNDGSTVLGRVDAAALSGALVLHADALYRNQRDYDTPDGRQPNSFTDAQTGALGASWVSDEGFLGVSVSNFENRYGNPGEPGDLANGERGVSLDLSQDRYEAKGGLQREFGVFSGARASLARTVYDHTEFEGDEVGTVFESKATEGRLELTHGHRHGWLGAFGAQVYQREFEAIGEEAFVPPITTRSGGIFVTEQTTWNGVQFDIGARVDRIRTDPDADLPDRSFNPSSLSADALWKLNEQWRFSLNVDRAERAPAEEELYANGPHVATAAFEIGDAGLDLERAHQLEVGVHFHGARFDAKASLYQTRFDDFIYLQDSGEFAEGEQGEEPLPIRLWSAEDAKFRGYEIEAIAHLVDSAAGRLDFRVFTDRVRATFDAGGNVPRIVPQRVGADLRWNASAWRISVGATRYDRQDDVAPNESPTDGYTLVDAHFAYHVDGERLSWELFVDANNLRGQVGRVHTSFLKDAVVLPGRNYSAGLRVFF
ncbi:MAG: TonB-dependent receptor [Pseudomarimonas sp.]